MNSENNLASSLSTLLEPACLDKQALHEVLESMMSHAINYADLYFQANHHESWTLEDGLIKEWGYCIDYGVGVRAISGEKTGFAYSNTILLPALKDAAKAARCIALKGGENRVQVWMRKPPAALHYDALNPLKSTPEEEKVELLKKLDSIARNSDSRVKQVIANLSGVYEIILIVATDGTFSADVRPLVRLNVSVIVEENGRWEQATHGGGGRDDYHIFLKDTYAMGFAKEAVRQALVNLEAVPAPAGTMPVVLGPGWPGVLLHEAVGHGLEGDFIRKGSSLFSNRLGEQVASPLCTVVDNGTLKARRGSLNIDDEGTPTEYTTLIEKGVLKGYMQDKLNARLMGTRSTGNGRRESYAHLPMPRMTNTYMLPGNHDPQEIITSIDKGIYAVNFGGGQVDITSGKFVFTANEAYLIEKGKITSPIKGATLIGNGPDILRQISMVGNDLKFEQGVGVCGKEGQSIPVGVGQPTLKIDALTVGGTQFG